MNPQHHGITKLSDQALLGSLTRCLTSERQTLVQMLELIAEVDKRRLYLERGYSSMFAFAVTELRMSEDAAYRRSLLTRGFALSHSADEEDRNVGKSLLRDYINATLGFQSLAKELGKKPESLMRMLSAAGNPRLSNFAELVECLFEQEGLSLRDDE